MLFGESVFYYDGEVENDGLQSDAIYVETRNDAVQEIKSEMEETFNTNIFGRSVR